MSSASGLTNLDPITRQQVRAKILQEIERRERLKERAPQLRAKFREFSRASWHIVEPAYKFIPNWHIDAICDHLQAVADRQIQNLIINIPPGHAKSLIVAVQWPAWMWIRQTKWETAAAWRGLFSSYAGDLSKRDSGRTQGLVESAWYRDMFAPQWVLTKRRDDNLANSASGFRLALSIGGRGTGERGDARVVDDPMNREDQHSELKRKEANEWWDQTMSSRLNNLAVGASVIIMQRLHEDDLSGHNAPKGNYELLVLPSEFEPERRSHTFITVNGLKQPFWEDPRRERGELLFPELFPSPVIEQAKVDLGSYGYAGQHQQRPAPESGGIFQRASLQRYKEAPAEFDMILAAWDCAFKDAETNDFVAGIVIGVKRAGFYVLDLIKAHLGFDKTEDAIKDTGAKWRAPEPRAVTPWAPNYRGSLSAILIEDAANGPAIISRLKKEIPGVLAVPTEGGKYARAWSCQPTVEAEQVFIPLDAPWAGDFIESLATFPNATHDDDVDAFTHVLAYVRKNMHGLVAYYREEADKLKIAKVEQSAFIKPVVGANTQKCPKCGSAAIAVMGSVFDKGQMVEAYRCGQCGGQWTA